MPETETTTFEGFRPEAIEFLVELAENNSREWFQPRKADYERLLKVPMEQLCVALEDAVPRRAASRSTPTRRGRRSGSTATSRFSKDKSPYKTAASASFRWAGDGVDAACRPVAHGARARGRRLLPPPAGRDLRRRRRVAPRPVVAQRVPAAGRRRLRGVPARSSRRRPSPRRSARWATTASRSGACRRATRRTTRRRTCCARRT